MIAKQVTKELCQEIANKKATHSKVEVVKFCVEELGRNGLVEEYFLKVVAKSCVVETFILKTPSKENPDLFSKERMMYSILPQHEEITADCFHSSEDLLVLSNLADCGYKRCDVTNLDEDHVKVALNKIADLHVLDPPNAINQSTTNAEQLRILHERFMENTKEIQLKKLERKAFEEKLSALFEEMVASFKPSKEFSNVINHGDLRIENFWFRYEDGVPIDCKLSNFYFAHSSPPANDVLFFLLNVTTEEERRKHFQEYLEYYFNCVDKRLKDKNGVQWDDFYLSCKTLLPPNKLRNAYFSDDINKSAVKLENVLTNHILSEEDCFAIVSNRLGSLDYNLLDYKINGFEEVSGYLGDHFTLKINISSQIGKEELGFFVKAVPTAPSQREFGMENGAFFKEYRMFTKLVSLLKKHDINILENVIPKTYLCRVNDVLVEEDLVEQGFVKLKQQFSLEFQEVVAVMKALARFHAAFLILEEKIGHRLGRTYRLNQEFNKEFEETFYGTKTEISISAMEACKTGARASVEMFHSEERTLDKETLFNLLARGINKQEANVKPSERFRNTITHGDLWVNNVLFRYENGAAKDCRIIDFQSYRYHPPAHDVLGILHLTTDREFRSKYLSKSLNIYFEELSTIFSDHGLPDLISKEEFEESCIFYKESVLVQTMTHFQVILMPADVSKYLFENPDELRKAFFVDKYKFVQEMCARDENFRRRNRECFLDLAEYFESLHVNQ